MCMSTYLNNTVAGYAGVGGLSCAALRLLLLLGGISVSSITTRPSTSPAAAAATVAAAAAAVGDTTAARASAAPSAVRRRATTAPLPSALPRCEGPAAKAAAAAPDAEVVARGVCERLSARARCMAPVLLGGVVPRGVVDPLAVSEADVAAVADMSLVLLWEAPGMGRPVWEASDVSLAAFSCPVYTHTHTHTHPHVWLNDFLRVCTD